MNILRAREGVSKMHVTTKNKLWRIAHHMKGMPFIRTARADYTAGDALAHLVLGAGGAVHGMKKLVKLAFLAQYDIEGSRAVEYLCGGRPLMRVEFRIWLFGPSSLDIYGALAGRGFSTRDEREGDRHYVVVKYRGRRPRLPEQAARRIDRVVEKYGSASGQELEDLVNALLGLDEERKERYAGWPVRRYLESEGFNAARAELCGEESQMHGESKQESRLWRI